MITFAITHTVWSSACHWQYYHFVSEKKTWALRSRRKVPLKAAGGNAIAAPPGGSAKIVVSSFALQFEFIWSPGLARATEDLELLNASFFSVLI